MRFYYESDGSFRQLGYRTHYVVDKYANPMNDRGRTDVQSRAEGLELARRWNRCPPWPAWDDIQAKRDNYQGEICQQHK